MHTLHHWAYYVTVQFGSRWYLYAQKSPYTLHPVSQKFPNIACETVPVFIWFPFSSFQGRLLCTSSLHAFVHFLITCLSLSGDQWCDVPGFVPAYSVSSSSTFQIFWGANHLWWLLCPPVHLLCHLPSLKHVQGIHMFFKVDVEHWHMLLWASHSTFRLLQCVTRNIIQDSMGGEWRASFSMTRMSDRFSFWKRKKRKKKGEKKKVSVTVEVL